MNTNPNQSEQRGDSVPLEVLDVSSESLLSFYLRTNLEKYEQKKYKHFFFVRQRGQGRVRAPPASVRGFSKNYEEVMREMLKYMSMANVQQETFNKDYRQSTSSAQKKEFKSNLTFLNSKEEKEAAVRRHPNGADVAQGIGYAFDGAPSGADLNGGGGGSPIHRIAPVDQTSAIPQNEENEESNEEESEEHVALFDEDATRRDFQNSRADKRNDAKIRWKRPKLGEAPTNYQNLCRQVCQNAETAVMIKHARFLDSTFVQDPKPGAPTRTGALIFYNECNPTGKNGGRVGKIVRREKPKLTVVTNSADEFKVLMGKLKSAFCRTEGNNHDEIECETITRDIIAEERDGEEQDQQPSFNNLEEKVRAICAKDKEHRANPQRGRVSPTDVFACIQNRRESGEV